MTDTLLQVDHLTTSFDMGRRTLVAVDDVSFSVRSGETLGLVGESGSGKSVTAFSIMRLVQPPGRIVSGSIRFRDRDLMALGEFEMCRVRGADNLLPPILAAVDARATVGEISDAMRRVFGEYSATEA